MDIDETKGFDIGFLYCPHIEIGAFIVAPNHFHGLIELADGQAEDSGLHPGLRWWARFPSMAMFPMEAWRF